MLFYLLKPAVDICKALFTSHIKHDYDSVSALVVCVGDCSVAFLSSRVPDLQLDCCLVDLKSAESLLAKKEIVTVRQFELTKSTPIVQM